MTLELTLQREPETAKSIPGTLHSDHQLCYTMERRADDPDHPCIVPGRYRVISWLSPHFKSRVPLLVGVPNRTDIEIHPGSFVENSHGCILVGSVTALDFLGSSVMAFQNIVWPLISGAILDGVEVWLTVLAAS